MGLSVEGVVEARYRSDADWKFVCKIDNVLATDNDVTFRDFILGREKFELIDPIPDDRGFPDDLSITTKAVMAGYLIYMENRGSHEESLDEHFKYVFGRELSKPEKCLSKHFTLYEYKESGWADNIKDKQLDELKKRLDEGNSIEDYIFHRSDMRPYFEFTKPNGYKRVLEHMNGREIELVLNDETFVTEKLPDNKFYSKNYSQSEEIDIKDITNKDTEYGKRKIPIRKRPVRESLPESWLKLLELLETTYDADNIRFIFYVR